MAPALKMLAGDKTAESAMSAVPGNNRHNEEREHDQELEPVAFGKTAFVKRNDLLPCVGNKRRRGQQFGVEHLLFNLAQIGYGVNMISNASEKRVAFVVFGEVVFFKAAEVIIDKTMQVGEPAAQCGDAPKFFPK